MSYACTLLANSQNPQGDRLTTFEVTFPRMVLADMTRHRSFSYSFESTRAVPTEKRIEQVRENPYVPDFRARAKGMGGGGELSPTEQQYAQHHWLVSATLIADTAERLLFAGKEHVGRLLEPYAWITGIVSGTEWENFFGLRCPPEGETPDPKYGAQIELQIIANMMRDQYRTNEPRKLRWGQWHLPYFDHFYDYEGFNITRRHAEASAGKCAGVSFLRHHDADDLVALAEKWNTKLAASAHWSPGEHPAMAERGVRNHGNYTGFKQLRKFYPGESIYVPPTAL